MARRIPRREFLRSLATSAGTLVLAACGSAPATSSNGNSTGSGESGTSSQATTAPASEAGTYPISTDGLSLTYWVETGANIVVTSPTFADITAYKELKKVTGINLEFQHPPTGPNQGREQFNLMVASGKFPDIIETNWLNGYYDGGPSKALRDGVIIRLNELIDQYAPNLKKVLDEHPDWRKRLSPTKATCTPSHSCVATPR